MSDISPFTEVGTSNPYLNFWQIIGTSFFYLAIGIPIFIFPTFSYAYFLLVLLIWIIGMMGAIMRWRHFSQWAALAHTGAFAWVILIGSIRILILQGVHPVFIGIILALFLFAWLLPLISPSFSTLLFSGPKGNDGSLPKSNSRVFGLLAIFGVLGVSLGQMVSRIAGDKSWTIIGVAIFLISILIAWTTAHNVWIKWRSVK